MTSKKSYVFLWTFTLILGWVSFLWMGLKTKTVRWIIYSLFYFINSLSFIFLTSFLLRIYFGLYSWLISDIFHIFQFRIFYDNIDNRMVYAFNIFWLIFSIPHSLIARRSYIDKLLEGEYSIVNDKCESKALNKESNVSTTNILVDKNNCIESCDDLYTKDVSVNLSDIVQTSSSFENFFLSEDYVQNELIARCVILLLCYLEVKSNPGCIPGVSSQVKISEASKSEILDFMRKNPFSAHIPDKARLYAASVGLIEQCFSEDTFSEKLFLGRLAQHISQLDVDNQNIVLDSAREYIERDGRIDCIENEVLAQIFQIVSVVRENNTGNLGKVKSENQVYGYKKSKNSKKIKEKYFDFQIGMYGIYPEKSAISAASVVRTLFFSIPFIIFICPLLYYEWNMEKIERYIISYLETGKDFELLERSCAQLNNNIKNTEISIAESKNFISRQIHILQSQEQSLQTSTQSVQDPEEMQSSYDEEKGMIDKAKDKVVEFFKPQFKKMIQEEVDTAKKNITATLQEIESSIRTEEVKLKNEEERMSSLKQEYDVQSGKLLKMRADVVSGVRYCFGIHSAILYLYLISVLVKFYLYLYFRAAGERDSNIFFSLIKSGESDD